MSNANHAIEALVASLQSYLAQAISGLTVLAEFPDPNQRLKYPSLSIFSGDPQHQAFPPTKVSQTTPDTQGRVVVTQFVGEYDLTMQLDLWCSSKPERDLYIGKVLNAINAQSMDLTGKRNPTGLSLQLANYFGEWARYDIDGHSYRDDEQAAERRERRAKIRLLANVREITQRTYYVMKHVKVQLGVGETQDPSDTSTANTDEIDVF